MSRTARLPAAAALGVLRPAVVVDVRRQAAANADYEVTVADLRSFEARRGRIPAGAAVIAWTGWQDAGAPPPAPTKTPRATPPAPTRAPTPSTGRPPWSCTATA